MKYILVLVLMLSCVYADREGGPYIGVGYGTSEYNDAGFYDALIEAKSPSINIYGGAYINKYFSVELNYVKFAKYNAILGSKNKSLEFYMATVATVVHYPFYDDMFDVYAKFGVGRLKEIVANEKGFTFINGMGLSLRMNESVSLKIAYDLYPFGYDTNGDKVADYNQNIKNIYTAIEFQF